MATLPTTTLNPLEGLVKPHSDTHRREGTDPILGDIIFHGSATLASDFENSSTTLTDVPSFSVDVNAKGGTLLIMITSKREVRNTNTATATLGASMGTTVTVGGVAQTIFEDGFGVSLNSGTFLAVGITSGSTQSWLYPSAIGQLTIQPQTKFIGTVNDAEDWVTMYAGAVMLVFEILPTTVN